MIQYPGTRPVLTTNDAYLFLTKELEKVDEKILEPLTGTDWPRDMPVKTGGGLLENIVAVDVTYASSGGEEDNLLFGAANDIPVIQADMSKSVARCFNFAEYISFPMFEDLIQCHKAQKLLKSKGLPDQAVADGLKKRLHGGPFFIKYSVLLVILSNVFILSNGSKWVIVGEYYF